MYIARHNVAMLRGIWAVTAGRRTTNLFSTSLFPKKQPFRTSGIMGTLFPYYDPTQNDPYALHQAY